MALNIASNTPTRSQCTSGSCFVGVAHRSRAAQLCAIEISAQITRSHLSLHSKGAANGKGSAAGCNLTSTLSCYFQILNLQIDVPRKATCLKAVNVVVVKSLTHSLPPPPSSYSRPGKI